MNISFCKASLGEEEESAAIRVMRSGWLAAGKEVAAFEDEFSTYISPPGGKYYCIFTNSCTSALKMAYKWARENVGYEDWDTGEKSLTIHYPKNTFCATYSSAIEMGVYTRTYGPTRKTKVPNRVNVHYGSVKDETSCLLEDSAHRIEPNDPLVGKIRCYSFYATKNMTTGSGGMFVTKDKKIYERARLFWRDGLSTSTEDRHAGILRYGVEVAAGGYDGNDLAAAIGRVQLGKLPQFTARRNDIKDYYNRTLSQDWQGNHLYPYFFGVNPEVIDMYDKEETAYQIISWMKEQGIQCSYHYPGTSWGGVSLPIYPSLTDGEIEYVADKVKEYAARV